MKDLANVIIKRKAGHFLPDEFNDRYEDAVVELIRAKQAGLPAQAPEQPSRPTNVVSIMDALRKSIAAAGSAAPEAGKARATASAAPEPRPKAASKAKGGSGKVAATAAPAHKARKTK
jgi:DNA end-binding protein Ku